MAHDIEVSHVMTQAELSAAIEAAWSRCQRTAPDAAWFHNNIQHYKDLLKIEQQRASLVIGRGIGKEAASE